MIIFKKTLRSALTFLKYKQIETSPEKPDCLQILRFQNKIIHKPNQTTRLTVNMTLIVFVESELSLTVDFDKLIEDEKSSRLISKFV